MNAPLVSVIIPTYNYAHFITEAIDSVLRQNYPQEKIEIIVLDDGSSDDTKDVLQAFIQRNTIKYFYQQNQGKASATQQAIRHSSGKYVFNLDADDYFLVEKIKRTVEVFESDETIVHVASPAQFFDRDMHTIKGAEGLPPAILGVKTDGIQLLKYFYRNNILYGGGSTFAAKASVLKQINIPAAVDMYIDEFLILTVFSYGKSFFIDQPLSVWSAHKFNYSGKAQNALQQSAKERRLLGSSAAVLDYIKQNNFDSSLVKIYTLKNSNRQIAFKETERTKSLKDIFRYAREIIFNIRPNWNLIKNYHVLNRFIPLSLYLFLKRIAK